MNEKLNEKEILGKIRYKIFKDYPFFAELSINKPHIFTEDIPTFAVALDESNNIVFLLNPEFLKSNEFEENMFAYLHELMHIALNHLLISKKHNDKDEFLLNIAQDIICNEYVRDIIHPSNKFKSILVFKENFKELINKDVKKMSHIEIYEILKKELENIIKQISLPLPSFSFSQGNNSYENNSQKNNKENSKSENGNNEKEQEQKDNDFLEKMAKDFSEKMKEFEKQLDKNGLSEEEKEIFKQAYKDFYFKKMFEKLSEKEKEKIKEKIKNEILQGYVLAKQRGLEFVGMEHIIEHLFKKVRDWKKILREEIISEIKGDYTWRKISDILQTLHIAGFKQIGNLPSLDNAYSIPQVVIGIDVSGSISDDDYKDFLNEIYSILKSVNINQYEIIMWETEITKVINSKNGYGIKQTLEELKKRKGYGGTNLRSFLEYCNKNIRNRNSIAVILTDGYIEADLKQEEFNIFKKVIFVLSKNCNYKNIAKLKNSKIKVLKIE